jgi:hypothetical protein
MAKGKTTGNLKGGNIRNSQTEQSFEQDVKCLVGSPGAASEPALMKKYISLAWQLLTLNHWPR